MVCHRYLLKSVNIRYLHTKSIYTCVDMRGRRTAPNIQSRSAAVASGLARTQLHAAKKMSTSSAQKESLEMTASKLLAVNAIMKIKFKV